MWFRSPVARMLYLVLGAAIGVAVTMTSPLCCAAKEWILWASTAIALTTASGAVFGYGLARWPDVAALGAVNRRRVAGFVIVILAIWIAVLTQWALLPISGSFRGQVLVALAEFAAIPTLVNLAVIRDHARAVTGALGAQAETLLELRRLLSGMLGALGAILALATLATGAAVQMSPTPSPAVVVVFGGIGSAVVALAYALPASAWRASAQALCQTVTPLADAAPADLVARVGERRRLEQAFGVDRGVFADLQSGITIFAPLLAGAAAVFLPG